MTRPRRDIPAERAAAGRAVIIGLHLAFLAGYLAWTFTRSTAIDESSGCMFCFSPREGAMIYGVFVTGPVLIISLAIGLVRYGRRRKVLNSPVPVGAIRPALVHVVTGLVMAVAVLITAYLIFGLITKIPVRF